MAKMLVHILWTIIVKFAVMPSGLLCGFFLYVFTALITFGVVFYFLFCYDQNKYDRISM